MIRELIDDAIYKVPNFPKPHMLFYDITGILTRPDVFTKVVDYYVDRYAMSLPEAIVAIDSRGFLFAAPVAYVLKVPLLLVRKSGKLPRKTVKRKFTLEYGEDEVELNPDDIPQGNVILFDDLLATGGTAKAACLLLQSQGARIQEIASIIALDFLPYAKMLEEYTFHYLISYAAESC